MLLGASILVGWLASFSALLGRYWTLPGFLTGPKICKTEAGGCQALFRTRNAALLGLPNSFLGIAFYGLLAVGLWKEWPVLYLWVASCPAVLMSAWLARILLRDRLECRICWIGHFCNTMIWIVLLSRAQNGG